MKLAYADMKPATGHHVAGICSIYVAPKQWLDADPQIEFETGRVMNAIALKDNKFWIRIDLVPQSYNFVETPKDSKSGDFKEIALSGTLNFYNFFLQQQLETLRRCQLVVLLTDMNKRRRLIGDTNAAMVFKYGHSVNKEEIVQVNMIMESEDPAPFYNPDSEPEIIYNLLENIDGNFLLVE
jgi:hypothetical protein